MTRILEIAGTDVRMEIDECDDCPMDDDERGVCQLLSELMLPQESFERCPLPEKNPQPIPNEPADEADALWRALRCAEQAFEESLEENNLDPVYFAHRFTGMILSIDFATITETITVDDLERRLTRSEEPPDDR